MSSILNSISQGDLQVQHAPREKPVKEDSIIELLKNPEIEFEIYYKPEIEIHNPVLEDDVYYDPPEYDENIENSSTTSISDLLENSEIELTTCPKLENKLEDINTGFGENQDLHYEDPCKKPELKTPLYAQNYLSEFVTEEEKAAARHSLGLFNKEDIVAMSLLTAEDEEPSQQQWEEATTKQLRKGDKFFAPFTLFQAVYDSTGQSLQSRFDNLHAILSSQQAAIDKINERSIGKDIKSLGDIKVFLAGFNNGDNLHNTLTNMDKEMLRFEKTGDINIK